MAKYERVILSTMCMLEDRYGNVLVQDRSDPVWPGVVFPGGKVEAGESFVQSAKREVYEETGLVVENPVLCGIKQFRAGENRCIVLLFRANRFSGILRSSDEGEVFWTLRSKLRSLPLAKEFSQTLRVFEDDSISECDYQGEVPLFH